MPHENILTAVPLGSLPLSAPAIPWAWALPRGFAGAGAHIIADFGQGLARQVRYVEVGAVKAGRVRHDETQAQGGGGEDYGPVEGVPAGRLQAERASAVAELIGYWRGAACMLGCSNCCPAHCMLTSQHQLSCPAHVRLNAHPARQLGSLLPLQAYLNTRVWVVYRPKMKARGSGAPWMSVMLVATSMRRPPAPPIRVM